MTSSTWLSRAQALLAAVLLSLALLPDANARTPKESDLSSLTEFEKVFIDVKSDGTYSFEYERKYTILSEAGRDGESAVSIDFNGRTTTFDLLEAKTINGTAETPLTSKHIEIKESSDSKVFDSNKQAVLSFPAVQLGSKLYYKYRMKIREVSFPGFFSTAVGLGLVNLDRTTITVLSQRPLFHKIVDPMGLLKVIEGKQRDRYRLEISNLKPVRLGVVQEDAVFVSNLRLSKVLMSTEPKWEGFARLVIAEQEKELAKPLLPPFKAIADRVKSEAPERRAAAIGAAVAQEFRYFGDWRRRRGGHIPRSLQEIQESGYGDCKDLSLVVVAIARSLGLKAELAWIWRDEARPDDIYYLLPNEYGFNHAIARIEDGKLTHWVDPTNAVAIPRGIFADIGDRPALLLAADGARFENTPALEPGGAKTRIELDLAFRASGQVDMKGFLAQSGRSVLRSEWALLHIPREQFEQETARWMARNEKLERYTIQLPPEPSRLTRDLRFAADLSIADAGLRTTAGLGFPLVRNEVVDSLLVDTKDRFSDIWLGQPFELHEEYRLHGVRIIGGESLACNLKSEWIDLRRELDLKRSVPRIVSHYRVKKPFVSNAALQTSAFQRFHNKVHECFNRAAVILERARSAAEAPPAAASSKSRSS